MEEVVSPESYGKALKAVEANDGSPGVDGMTTKELSGHLKEHWEKIQAKLMAGSYIPSPVKRKEIRKETTQLVTERSEAELRELVESRRIALKMTIQLVKAKMEEANRLARRVPQHFPMTLREDAEALDCVHEVSAARDILARGSSADTQLELYRAARNAGRSRTQALREVIDWLRRTTAES